MELNFNPMMQALGNLQGQYRYEHENKLQQQQLAENQRRFELAQQQQSQGGGVSYGKSPNLVQGPDGRLVALQFADDGSFKSHPLQGYTPFRGTSTVDTGTGTQIIDRATGQPVRTVDKAIVEAETQKKIGQAKGEGWATLPKVSATLDSVKSQSNVVQQDIDRALQGLNTLTTGPVNQYASYIPGMTQLTGGYDLSRTLDTIKANVGFDKLQEMRDLSPTGGALGQVSERELGYLQSVMGSFDQSQSEKQIRDNLNRLKFLLRGRVQRLQAAYEQDVKRFGSANVPRPEGVQPMPEQQQQAPEPAQQPAQPPQTAQASPIARAQEAIARGAPREAVIARLREAGINTSGL